MKTKRRTAAAKRRPVAATKRRPARAKKRRPVGRPKPALPSWETQRLLHELQVHSEEITVQNEQLLRTHAELERARDRYADLYDHAPIGYMELDAQGMILDINHAGCALLGRTRDTATRAPLAAHVTKAHRQRVRQYLSRIGSQEQQAVPDIEFQTDQSPPRVVRLLTRRVSVEPGRNRLLSAMFDVTEEQRLMQDREEVLGRERVRTAELSREVDERLAAEEQVKRLLERLVTVQEEERRRMARNLHDDLGQQLTALRLTLGMLRDAVIGNREYRQRLDTIDMMVGALDRNLDFLAWGLRPVALDDVGLSAALAEFVRQWSISTSIPAEYHESNADQVRFAPDVESNLYRIVQEALNNIAKHSGAAAASVLLEYRGDTVTLIVEDDGGGFDSDRAWSNRTRHGGIGLISIHERAALMGGQVQFESTPGKGTTLFVRIPVPKP